MNHGESSRRIFVRWGVWSVWIFALMRMHPLAMDWFPDGIAGVGLTAWQCFLVQGFAVGVWIALIRLARLVRLASLARLAGLVRLKSQGIRVGQLVSALPAAILAIDLWVFHLAGLHLWSSRFGALLIDLPTEIVGFVSWGVVSTLLILGLGWSLGWVACSVLECRVVARQSNSTTDLSPLLNSMVAAANMMLLLTVTQGGAFLSRYPEWPETLRQQSSRHPLVAMGWLSREDSLSTRNGDVDPLSIERFSIEPTELKQWTDQRISQMRMNVVVADEKDGKEKTSKAERPDILIVIGESLRPELLRPDIMPETFELTRRGTWLKQHYSGGNSSSLGVFSIVSGLEAFWFYKSDVRFAPSMNRLFRQAGYELGFFASTNDWTVFQMDAFLSDSQYDVFDSKDFEGLVSDQNAIASTKRFLNDESTRPPRLAVVCLYGTHAPFWCDRSCELDQPAASDAYPIPFPRSWRESVWNRYRNAARTVDTAMASLLDEEAKARPRITVVTGDHGESFGEDGTIGHGTRLSVAQTQTMAVIAGPGIPNRVYENLTHHGDWLPTLLAAAGIQTTMPEQFDGIDLAAETISRDQRLISLASYTGKEIAILESDAPNSARETWGVLCEFSLMDAVAKEKYPISRKGVPLNFAESSSNRMKRWIRAMPFVR